MAFLTDPACALFAVMAVTVWSGMGYYMVIYLAGLQAIPRHLYEAAEVEGVSAWQQFLHITLPLLRPSMAVVAVMSSIAAMKVFEEVYVMTQGGPMDASKTLVYPSSTRPPSSSSRWGWPAAASAWCCSLITLALSLHAT